MPLAFFGLDRETLLIDYDEMERMARTLRPKMILLGISAYSRDIDFARAAAVAHEVGALLCADLAHTGGLVAAGLAANPFPHADIAVCSGTKTLCGPHTGFILCRDAVAAQVDAGTYPAVFSSVHLQSIAALAWQLREVRTPAFRDLMERVVANARALSRGLMAAGIPVLTGGTDNHMLIADLRPILASGDTSDPAVEALAAAGIITNTKKLPFDGKAARGIRLGATVAAQRGLGEDHMAALAAHIAAICREPGNEARIAAAKADVDALCTRYPSF